MVILYYRRGDKDLSKYNHQPLYRVMSAKSEEGAASDFNLWHEMGKPVQWSCDILGAVVAQCSALCVNTVLVNYVARNALPMDSTHQSQRKGETEATLLLG